MEAASSYLVGNKKLGTWSRMVERLGFPAAIALILLAVVLTFFGSFLTAAYWVANNVATPMVSGHVKFLAEQGESSRKTAEAVSQLSSAMKTFAEDASDTKDLLGALVESDKAKAVKLNELVESQKEAVQLMREHK